MAAKITDPKQVEAICPRSGDMVPHGHKGPTVYCPECGRKLKVKQTKGWWDGHAGFKVYPHHLDSQRGLMF